MQQFEGLNLNDNAKVIRDEKAPWFDLEVQYEMDIVYFKVEKMDEDKYKIHSYNPLVGDDIEEDICSKEDAEQFINNGCY